MDLHDKIWWTRKSRIHTERRLRSNESQAQIILLWYAFFSVAVSIFFLVAKSNSSTAPGIWVILSVFSLVASGFISGLNYRGRANLIKECYETLEGLRHEAVLAKDNLEDLKDLNARYIKTLGLCENHSDIDYRAARCEMHLSGDRQFEPKISKYDYFLWLGYKALRFIVLAIIYASPVVILIALEFKDVCGKAI